MWDYNPVCGLWPSLKTIFKYHVFYLLYAQPWRNFDAIGKAINCVLAAFSVYSKGGATQYCIAKIIIIVIIIITVTNDQFLVWPPNKQNTM
jgi:hypothetical protein